MKGRFDLLIFDWDGTLFDSVQWIVECLRNAAREVGLPVPSDRLARSVIGLSLDQAMKTLFPESDAAVIPPLMAAYHRYYEVRNQGPDDLFEGVPEMLDALRAKGYRLAVATGKNRRGLDKALDATGARHWFHATRCAGEAASKPDPLMLWQLLEELGTPPQRALMVGDSIYDLQMAKNAGVAAVGVFCGANEREELLAFEPLLGVERAADLLGWLL